MNTLIQGDCVDIMEDMDAESIDLVITDPPFGIEFDGTHRQTITSR